MLKIKILLLIQFFLLSCLENTINCTTGDDNVVNIIREVDIFNSLTSSTSGSVMVIQGGAQELVPGWLLTGTSFLLERNHLYNSGLFKGFC